MVHITSPLLLAVVGGALTILQLLPLSDAFAFQLLSVMLAMIAAVYLGFALVGPSWRGVIEELVGLHAFLGVAMYCLNAYMHGGGALALAAGYFGHGVWDLLHHNHVKLGTVQVLPWYPPFCLYYDWAMAAFIVWRFYRY